jgi:thiosulfate/3-mercaptopyruvate sulfurtransferase
MSERADDFPSLVATDWLAAHLGDSDLLVFDATVYMPNEGRNAQAEFAEAHIPGAGFFDIDAIADNETALPHMVPASGRFEHLIGALGISNDCSVVMYDQKGLFSAPRAWWILRLFGHSRVAVLDGGLPKWRREGRALVGGAPKARAPAIFRASLNARKLRGAGDILRNLRTKEELVVDARPQDRFYARVPEPRPGLRGGHIPGAVSLPFQELLSAEQTLLDPQALRTRFAAAGVDSSRPVVTSCGSGLSAAILTLGLHVAGLPEGALYDGSWTEWAGRSDTPVATGAD